MFLGNMCCLQDGCCRVYDSAARLSSVVATLLQYELVAVLASSYMEACDWEKSLIILYYYAC